MRGRIFFLPVLQELEEPFRSALLEYAHERALDGLHLRARHLGDAAIAVDEAARDLLELEVACDIGMHEDLGQFTRGDDELGDQVYGVVAVAAQLPRRLLARTELSVQLGKVPDALGLD